MALWSRSGRKKRHERPGASGGMLLALDGTTVLRAAGRPPARTRRGASQERGVLGKRRQGTDARAGSRVSGGRSWVAGWGLLERSAGDCHRHGGGGQRAQRRWPGRQAFKPSGLVEHVPDCSNSENQTSNVRIQRSCALYEEFNWCPVAPIDIS